MISGCYVAFAERLLLFLLAGLLLCLLRFLGHVALRDPQKLAQCKSRIDMHKLRLHHNCKIDTTRFEEGKQPSHRRMDEALACYADTAHCAPMFTLDVGSKSS